MLRMIWNSLVAISSIWSSLIANDDEAKPQVLASKVCQDEFFESSSTLNKWNDTTSAVAATASPHQAVIDDALKASRRTSFDLLQDVGSDDESEEAFADAYAFQPVEAIDALIQEDQKATASITPAPQSKAFTSDDNQKEYVDCIDAMPNAERVKVNDKAQSMDLNLSQFDQTDPFTSDSSGVERAPSKVVRNQNTSSNLKRKASTDEDDQSTSPTRKNRHDKPLRRTSLMQVFNFSNLDSATESAVDSNTPASIANPSKPKCVPGKPLRKNPGRGSSGRQNRRFVTSRSTGASEKRKAVDHATEMTQTDDTASQEQNQPKRRSARLSSKSSSKESIKSSGMLFSPAVSESTVFQGRKSRYSLKRKIPDADDDDDDNSVKSDIESPHQRSPRKRLSIASSVCSDLSLDQIMATEPEIFRFNDLPQELQNLIFGFAYESGEDGHSPTYSKFPTYDYLIPDQEENNLQSEPFITGHRIWVTPHIKIAQFAVSRKFLRDALCVLGKLVTIEIPTTRRAMTSRGGAVFEERPIRNFTHSRHRYEESFIQKTLTVLLSDATRLKVMHGDRKSYCTDCKMPKKILNLIVPLMPSLEKIEAYECHPVFWVRPLFGGFSRLFYGDLDIPLQQWDRSKVVARLDREELEACREEKCLPRDLCTVITEDDKLAQYQEDVVEIKKSLATDGTLRATSEVRVTDKVLPVEVSLYLWVTAQYYDNDPNICRYKDLEIPIKLDGDTFSYFHDKSEPESER